MNDASAQPPERPSWVWVSTPESVQNNTFSVLAAVETLLCAATYLSAASWWGGFLFWWTSFLMAPFLLLRSPQSTSLEISIATQLDKIRKNLRDSKSKRARENPDQYDEIALIFAGIYVFYMAVVPILDTYVEKSMMGNFTLNFILDFIVALLIVGVGLICGLFAAFLHSFQLISQNHVKFTCLFVGVLIVFASLYLNDPAWLAVASGCLGWIATRWGAAIGSALEPKLDDYLVEARKRKPQLRKIGWAVFFLTNIVAFLIQTQLIRIISILRHPVSGFKTIPDNWRRAMFTIDIRSPPDIAPGTQLKIVSFPHPFPPFAWQTPQRRLQSTPHFSLFLFQVLFIEFL